MPSSQEGRRALITGFTGQDGSYLAEQLLEKGYQVYGLVRRLSTPNTRNIAHLHDRVTFLDGDLHDAASLDTAMRAAEPDEIYNLAAQSFVGASFNQPVVTGEVTGLGALRMLEAMRSHADKARFYQAASSEMFGKVASSPQDEATPFHPRSPYGVAKAYAFWACVNYRESYGMYVSNGILFNHECVTRETPVIIRDPSGFVDCLPIADVLPDPGHLRQAPLSFDVWDNGGFTRASLGTANWNGPQSDRAVHRIVARCGEIRATANHKLMRSDGSEISAESVTPGERLLRTRLPPAPGRTKLTAQFSRLLGLLAAEGSVTSEEHPVVTFRNNEKRLLDDVQKLWEQVAGGTVADFPGVSGFTGEPTGGLRLNGSPTFASYLRTILYTKQSQKRVPHIVLNSDEAAWRAFLSGYNEGDGLRAGHGRREFKNFKTSSPTLGAGLWWMASITLPQKLTLNVDFVRRGPLQDQLYWYYSINLGSDAVRAKTSHLARLSDEVKLVAPDRYIGWVYDIATASGTFHAGIGDLVIHNSPRRGHEFVTRKISDAVAKISLGRAKTVRLGTLTTRRDWGYAPEYCDFMYRVLQAPRADDFVGATGETHSVEEFVTEAFRCVGITDWKPHVVMDPKFARPAEVDTLLGNARKSKEQLGWEPKVRFLELVKIMVENDLQLIRATPSV